MSRSSWIEVTGELQVKALKQAWRGHSGLRGNPLAQDRSLILHHQVAPHWEQRSITRPLDTLLPYVAMKF